MAKKEFVNLTNARKAEQTAVMRRIIAEGVCPFCPKQLRKFHKQPVLKETKRWLLTKNQWPYDNTRVHLLAIYKTHAERLRDIPPTAGQELIELAQWAEKKFHIDGGGLVFRFGDPKYNGGTVRHLHAQLVVADVTDTTSSKYYPVLLKVG